MDIYNKIKDLSVQELFQLLNVHRLSLNIQISGDGDIEIQIAPY